MVKVKTTPKESVSKKKIYFVSFVYLLVASFWIISAWPANMSGDSFAVWWQVKNLSPYMDFHPTSYTIFVKITSLNGFSLGLTAIIQYFLTSLALFLLFQSFVKSINTYKNIALVTICMLFPPIALISLTIWKDVPFASLTLIGFCVFAKNRKEKSPKKILAVLLIGIGTSMRHEGFLTLALVLILQTLITLKEKNGKQKADKFTQNVLIYSCLVSFSFSSLLPGALNALPNPKVMNVMTPLRDLAATASQNPGKFDQSLYKKLRVLSSKEGWEAAQDCRGPNGYAASDRLDYELANKFSIEVPLNWIKVLFSRNGSSLIKNHYCFVQPFIPVPLSLSPGSGWYWIHWTIDPNSIGEPVKRSFPKFAANFGVDAWSQLWISKSRFLGWPGAYFSLLILILFFRKKINHIVETELTVLLFHFCHSIVLLNSQAQDYRYAWSLQIYIITLLCSVLFKFIKLKI